MERETQTKKMEYLPWGFCEVVMKRHAQDPSSKGLCISLTIDQTNMSSQDKRVDLIGVVTLITISSSFLSD